MLNRKWLMTALVTLSIGTSSAFARANSEVCFTDNIPYTLTNFNDTLSFQMFNPSDAFGDGSNIPGVLTSVKLTLDGALLGSMDLTNFGSAADISGSLTPSITVTRPDLTVLLNLGLNGVFGPILVNNGQTVMVGPITDMQSLMQAFNLPADLLLFTGPGTINLPVTATGAFMVTGGSGNVLTTAMTSVKADASVCYNFSIVPEPTTAGLVLVGVGLMLRKCGRRR